MRIRRIYVERYAKPIESDDLNHLFTRRMNCQNIYGNEWMNEYALMQMCVNSCQFIKLNPYFHFCISHAFLSERFSHNISKDCVFFFRFARIHSVWNVFFPLLFSLSLSLWLSISNNTILMAQCMYAQCKSTYAACLSVIRNLWAQRLEKKTKHRPPKSFGFGKHKFELRERGFRDRTNQRTNEWKKNLIYFWWIVCILIWLWDSLKLFWLFVWWWW